MAAMLLLKMTGNAALYRKETKKNKKAYKHMVWVLNLLHVVTNMQCRP